MYSYYIKAEVHEMEIYSLERICNADGLILSDKEAFADCET